MKKFVVIQLDGLSYRRLMDASHNGLVPTLTRLMDDGYKVHRYNCGLPSNTPFAQAGIMYGKNDEIPGFSFVDKRLRREFKVRSPLNMLYIEHAYFAGRDGILSNGNSYANIFSGGAMKSRMVSSQLLNEKSFFHQFDILLLCASPKITGHILFKGALNAATFLQLLYENAASLFSKYKAPSDMKYNVTRLFSSVVIEELETGALIKDMQKGIPYLYMTFNGYDENSHHQGPTSPAALDALATIDQKIGEVFRHKGDYDIYILSDHGHTESVPFRNLYGMSFPKFIQTSLKKYNHETRPHYFGRLKKELGVAGFLVSPIVRGEKEYHKLMVRSGVKTHSWLSHPYFLEVSDDMANLYFNFTDEKVKMDEMERRFPGFLETLRSHPGIGLVFGLDGDDVRILNRYGEARVTPHGPKFAGERFLKEYGDEKTLLKQIEYFARMRNSGDLVLFGDYSKRDVVSFVNHYGSHGSAGGEQTHPFFMSTHRHDLTEVTNVNALYDIFMRYHHENEGKTVEKIESMVGLPLWFESL